jgi:predicted regulator of Ras-like GTPase activity (Roadblock/LC7/MglB family)
MSLIQRMLAQPRIKAARHRLVHEPSARNFVQLASEHARLGEMDDVLRVCEEALQLHPGNPELMRMYDRGRALRREDRTRELSRELREAPRPGIYRELCEVLLEAGRVERSEECALEWFTQTGDGQAQLARAQARLQRFLTDRRREDGRLVCELLDSAEQMLPRDVRPLRMRLQLFTAIGAWRDARRVISQLLELEPGEPSLEARFRTLNAMAETAPAFDVALREVERTGHLADEEKSSTPLASTSISIRPMLQELAAQSGVHAAMFQRGATALIQGKKGATAERTARAIRDVVSKSCTAARRLGLGQALEIELEGDFGRVVIVPTEVGSAALWSSAAITERQRAELLELVGAGSDGAEEEQES